MLSAELVKLVIRCDASQPESTGDSESLKECGSDEVIAFFVNKKLTLSRGHMLEWKV